MANPMSDDSTRPGQRFKGSLNAVIVACVILFAIFFMRTSGEVVSLIVKDGFTTVKSQSGFSHDIDHAGIVSVDLIRGMDFGVLVSGTKTETEKSGIWRSDELGEYLLCVNSMMRLYIVVHCADGAVVFNYESDDATADFFDAWIRMLEDETS